MTEISAGQVKRDTAKACKQQMVMAAPPFDSAEVEELVVRFNAVMAKEATDIPDLGGNASDDEVAETLQETPGDLIRDEITQGTKA